MRLGNPTFASWNQIVLWLRARHLPSGRLTAAKSITNSEAP